MDNTKEKVNKRSRKKVMSIVIAIVAFSLILVSVLIICNQKNEFNITYVLNSEYALNNEENKTVVQKKEKLELKSASRLGYDFVRWCDEDYKTYNTIENLKNDLVLYAVWSLSIFSVQDGELSLTKYGMKKNSIVIPEVIEGAYVEKIAANAFSNDKNLKSLVIPKCIKEIGDDAFKDTPNLTTITYLGTEDEWKQVEKKTNDLYDKIVICSDTNQEETFTIQWLDFNDTVLTVSENQKFGTIPVYPNETPKRVSSEEFSYEFKGWTPKLTYITSNVAYKAIYEEIKNAYEVKFETNGGSNISSQFINYGEKLEKPKDPSKTNYEFDGWYIDEDFKTSFDFDTCIHENITLYASWKLPENLKKEYLITFISNGGTNVESQIVDEGGRITKPAVPTKDGFTFKYWYLDDENVEYNFYNLIYDATTLYAKWEKNSTDLEFIAITFETNGGSLLPSFELLKGTSLVRPNDPTKEGYVFDNWYKDSEFNEIFDFSSILTEHTKIYAKWTIDTSPVPKKVTVRFDLNGALGEIEPVEISYRSKVDEPNSPSRDGFFFKAWMLNDEIYNFDTPVCEDITLVAKWVQISDINYSISFYDDDGETLLYHLELLAGIVPVYGGEEPYKPADSVYSYKFKGWNHEIEMVESNQVYIAVYEKTYIEYEVKFIDYDGRVISSAKYHYEDEVVIPDNPTRESTDGKNYVFDGWSPRIDLVLGDATYYATYREEIN